MVLLSWIVALIGIAVIGQRVGSSYSQTFALPGTESQKATDLLQVRFRHRRRSARWPRGVARPWSRSRAATPSASPNPRPWPP